MGRLEVVERAIGSLYTLSCSSRGVRLITREANNAVKIMTPLERYRVSRKACVSQNCTMSQRITRYKSTEIQFNNVTVLH